MLGLMQAVPLTLTGTLERAERLYADRPVVTATAGGGRERTTYGAWAVRTRRLATVLDQLDVSADGRVGTFAWNTARHLELYFAVPCSGRVLHTLNIRLFPEQIAYVANHAEDEVVFVDRSLLGVLWPLVDELRSVRHVIVMDDGGDEPIPDDPRVLDYETLLAGAEPAGDLHVGDENRAAAMCYTSGTTGNPKGVAYTHRSITLHSLALMAKDTFSLGEADVVLPVVPMFHANAWGLAHAAVMCGAGLVLPGADLSGPALAGLMEAERVTFAAGVPTIWMSVLEALDGRDLSAATRIVGGGSAVPKALSEAYRAKLGRPILHAWGMTETSPVGAVNYLRPALAGLPDDELAELRTSVGVPAPLTAVRIVEPGGAEELPWDGEATGELQITGPWIAAGYYRDQRSSASFTDDGWLRTGDVASISAHGYVRLRDRTKDVIKSGGEWVSSVELENEIMAHPDVAEAAVIGVPDERWGERPLACVVARDGAALTAADVRAFLDGRVVKWWIPERVELIDEIPKTSVGKFSKKDLRARFGAPPPA
ncbi:MAG: long-chain fatty acid--CoA ligase [Conexibacter sp.]|nr:long-chain fatty acid--CoA ligase [Conexibacter sp.]